MPDFCEQDLRASASRLAALIEHLQGGVLVEDESRRVVHINAELCAKFGISVPPEDLVGADCSQAAEQFRHLFAKPEEFVKRTDELLRESRVVMAEELPLVDGRIFERDYIPIAVGNEPRGHLWQYRDVTERKRSEQELRESEEMFRVLFQHSPDAVTLTDPHDPHVFRRIVACNDAACEMNGYSREELDGRSIDLLHPERTDEEAYAESLEQLRREGTICLEAVHRRKDGTTFPIETRISLVRVRGRDLILGIDRDITERKQAEERAVAFFNLAHKLNSATTAVCAARIIAHAADSLLGWDACALLLRSSEDHLLHPILSFDVVHGCRTEFPPGDPPIPPGSLSRRAMEEGPQLLLPEQPSIGTQGLRPFGDTERPSASLMFVPIRGGGGVIGVLTVQSYCPKAYVRADLETLQALADQCGGALERIQAEEGLRESRGRLSEAQRMAHLGSWEIDLETGRMRWSDELYRIVGYSPQEVLPSRESLTRIIHPQDVERVQEVIGKAVERGQPFGLEHRVVHPDGEVRVVQVRGEATFDGDSRPIKLAGTTLDITERVRAEAALREAHQKLSFHVENSPLGVIEWDHEFRVARWSPQAEQIFGWEAGDVLGKRADEWRFVFEEDERGVEEIIGRLMGGAEERNISRNRNYSKNGSVISCEWHNSVLRDESGAMVSVLSLVLDVTEHEAYEEQLRHQALHDALTGLPNRVLFMDRLKQALARTARHGQCVAVLYLDMDRFKLVNDSLGHAAGDGLLVTVAQRLQGVVRPEDTVARLGGDEFVVLLEGVATLGETEKVAKRIEEALGPVFEVAEHEVVLTTSIGIAVGTAGRCKPEELLKAADIAMYKAKQGGKARYEVFSPGMDSRALELLELEADLRRAINRGEFRLHYQPKVELATGRITGAEALVRWEHPQRGMVFPEEFVGLAEETGLILPIDRWVLRESCRQVRKWQEQYSLESSFGVCVNVSPRYFQHPDLVGEVLTTLEETGLNPRSLMLEITESTVMEDAESNIAALRELKGLGVRLAIDDFGTGYSSLAYLRRFPVDVLKIDRSFVDGLGEESDDTVIVAAVIGLARSLRLEVIAEGVETVEQVGQLRALGCNLGQGYHFYRALPSKDMGALLAGGG